MRIKHRKEVPVLDVEAESIEPDLGGIERNFRRADQPRGVVDEADFAERRRMRQTRLPYPKRFERGDRTRQQSRSAVIGLRWRGNKQRIHAGCCKRKRTDKTGWSAANHRHFGGISVRCAVHR